MSGILAWVGARSHWVLVCGIGFALAAPGLATALRPALPALVALVLAAAAIRIDIPRALVEMARPRAALRLLSLAALLMPVAAALFALAGDGWATYGSLLIVFALAPPISSAASLSFMLGMDGKLALQATLAATLITPVVGPALLPVLAPGAAAVGALTLGRDLFLMIGAGLLLGVAGRAVIGAARAEAAKLQLDGVAALVLILFLIPLFDGVAATIAARPGAALAMLGFCAALNLGANALGYAIARLRGGHETAGAIGVLSGNRNVSLYLATLPPDPMLSLFVALYQLPMYATPLIGRWLFGVRG